eukprot:TRINITY_DN1471_c0_g1_i2.p1 TRINITY_DN1471_c0_g1~~TRINITY_DN1471_c0_g1_i2.p1  ORF type:complete len:164 (+),score=26.61 TRINITY_DN1471_c0_g1_i2:351-842(+)
MTSGFGLPNPPSVVEYKSWKFLIFDAPTDANIDMYIKEFKKHNVNNLVRACDPSYSTDKLLSSEIKVHEMPFPDGGFPNNEVVVAWIALCKSAYKTDKNSSIGVHCVAGLGRAPVLVALALMELGLHYEEAITLIREKRRGAINAKQLKYLKSYKPKKKCTIM